MKACYQNKKRAPFTVCRQKAREGRRLRAAAQQVPGGLRVGDHFRFTESAAAYADAYVKEEFRAEFLDFVRIENVKARLKLFYNEPLRIESAPGQGTRVSFVVHSQP